MGQGLERLGINFMFQWGDQTGHDGGLCASSG